MLNTPQPAFTAADFAELKALTGSLHSLSFPMYDGVDLDDLHDIDPHARLAFELHRLVAAIDDRQRNKLNHGKMVQQKVDRINRRVSG